MATDLEKAELIVEKYGSFVGNIGTMRPNIAKAVAEGIALVRREGLQIAAELSSKAIREHLEKFKLGHYRALRPSALADCSKINSRRSPSAFSGACSLKNLRQIEIDFL